MNWNLSFDKINTHEARLSLLFYDEPIIRKVFYKNIYDIGNRNYISYSENGKRFIIEEFNEFIIQLESNLNTSYYFDDINGEDSFSYNSVTEIFNINLVHYLSNIHISIPMNARTRRQFSSEFRKFLQFSLNSNVDLDMPQPHILN
jgi:hypothetical protein